jgi:opacity protein-like surface antigen
MSKNTILFSLIIIGMCFGKENEVKSESASNFNFLGGLKIGVNYDVAHTLNENTKRWDGLGYNIGLEFEGNLKNIIGLTIGCSYLRTAYTHKILGSGWGEDSTYFYNNLCVPVTIKLTLKIGERVHPFVKIGAAGVFELSGRIKGWIEPAPFDTKIDTLVNNYYFLGGLGTDIQITPKFKLSPVFSYQHYLNSRGDDEG